MNSEEVNFEYTLPEENEIKEKEIYNEKVKPNGIVNNQKAVSSVQNEENYKFEDESEENNEYQDYQEIEEYNAIDDKNDNNDADVQNLKFEDIIIDNNSNKVEHKEIQIQDASNDNMSNLSHYKYQSKFLSTQNDKIKSNNHLSRIQQAELSYVNVQKRVSKIFEEDEKIDKMEENLEFEAVSEVYIGQNLKLVKNLEDISQILNILIEATRMNAKRPEVTKKENCKKTKKKPNLNINQDIGSTENKLVEVFKTEYKKLKSRAQQLNGDNYEENMRESIKEITKEIAILEAENRSLKQNQKQSEAKFERQGKNPKETNLEMKKTSADFMNLRKLNEQIQEKIQKNKFEIDDNEKKISELNVKIEKTKEIAENYGINEDMINKKHEIKSNNTMIGTGNIDNKPLENIKITLLKKCDVFEKVSLSNKKKYEAEISRNIKAIYNLENNLRELHLLNREKSKTVYVNNLKVTELNDLYNATTSSTINSNLKEPIKNELINHYEKPIKQRGNDTGMIIPPFKHQIIEKNKPDNKQKSKEKKIKPMSQNEPNRRNIRTEKINNLEVKNKYPSINPDNDDTYFTQFSPGREKVNDKDKLLEETLLKAKEFIKNIQNSSSCKENEKMYEDKAETLEKNTIIIHNVDEEPIHEMFEKYQIMNKEKRSSAYKKINTGENQEENKEKITNKEENIENLTENKNTNYHEKEAFIDKIVESSMKIEESKEINNLPPEKSKIFENKSNIMDSDKKIMINNKIKKAPSTEKIIISDNNEQTKNILKKKSLENRNPAAFNNIMEEKKMPLKINETLINNVTKKTTKKVNSEFDDLIL